MSDAVLQVGTVVKGVDGIHYIDKRAKGKRFLPMTTQAGDLLVALCEETDGESVYLSSSSSDEQADEQEDTVRLDH